MSWIWRVPGSHDSIHPSGPDSEEFIDGVRVEWMKAKTRADRWSEEKELLQEEMRRVLELSEWKASWWLAQRHRRGDEHTSVLQGLATYAEKQAAVYNRLAVRFAGMWLPLLESQGIHPDWKSRYVEVNMSSDRDLSHSGMADSSSSELDSE